MSRKELILSWIDVFNEGDAEKLASFYADDAINHQVANDPISGKTAIQKMFKEEFSKAKMVCTPENIFEDGEWTILEWKDPKGFRGCGFFHIVDEKIIFQRGYWDKLSFLKLHGLE